MALALHTEHLTKRFGHGSAARLAVDGLNLSVESGQVYGFLGQNGAGKTTTIRLLLDLMRPTGGAAYLFGVNPRKDRNIMSRVGALVEGAAFYPHLSGRDNLELLRRMNGGKSRAIDPLLAEFGLTDHAHARFGTYSTGMKQRLGLAAALLCDPDLVILDEPTNGFDPVGLVEMRTMIRDLVDRDGKTVFLSSHLLGEVEQLCDRVAIIDEGRLMREGRIAELLTRQTTAVQIEVDDMSRALAVLEQAKPVASKNAIEVQVMHDEIPAIIAQLVNHQIAVYAVESHRPSLETFFLELVGKAD
jgi:ABC-2 type transport system ATP-binding protein